MNSFNIDNSNIKISTGVNSGLKAANTTSGSKTVSVQMTDTNKLALLKKLNITLDQYNAIKAQNPNFDTLSPAEQYEIIDNFSVKTPTLVESKTEEQDAKVEKTSTSTPEIKDIKAEYNKKDLVGKTEICYSEVARNIYIYGVKDKDKVIANAHSKEEWDKLSDEEKKAEVEKVKTFINSDERLKNVKNKYDDKVPENAKEIVIDGIMRAIQAANAEGVSIVDFMKKDEYERKELIEQYLFEEKEFNRSNLNKNDEEYLSQSKMLNSEVTKILEQKTGEKIGDILDTKSVGLYVKYYNLSEDELLHSALKEKVKNGEKLTDVEQKQYAKLTKSVHTSRGQLYIQDAKAQNVLELDKEFNTISAKIKKGENLSPEEQKAYSILKETLNTKENNELRKYAKYLPKPQTDYEKNIANDIADYKAQIKDYVHGTALETGTAVQFIENKTEGMSKAEKGKYIANFVKFNHSFANSKIADVYSKEYPELLGNFEIASAATINIGDYSDEQAAKINETIINTKPTNERIRKMRAASANTMAQVLASEENFGKAELDNKRVMATSTVEAVGTTEDINTYGVNVAASITDAKKSTEAISVLYNSDKANDDTYIAGVKVAKRAAVDAQAFYVVGAGQRSAKATVYIAENNIIAGLDKKAQTAALAGTNRNINRHFEGKDAIKYSNALADQIQYCDKDNQLAMHNEMMTSKYSEVQEHTARNIKNYDPTVQSEALSTVYKSGNEKAIAAAVNEVLPAIKSPDAQQIALKQAVMELAGISDNSDLQTKFANGTLTKAEIAQLSSTERRDYYVRLFDNATPMEKIEYLKSLPSGKSRQTVYNLIGTYYKNTFKTLVESDVTTAEAMYNMGLKTDLQNIVEATILFKAETNPSFKFLRDRLHLGGENDLANAETEPVTAKTINNFSIPKDFDTKELFKKDKNGIILA